MEKPVRTAIEGKRTFFYSTHDPQEYGTEVAVRGGICWPQPVQFTGPPDRPGLRSRLLPRG